MSVLLYLTDYILVEQAKWTVVSILNIDLLWCIKYFDFNKIITLKGDKKYFDREIMIKYTNSWLCFL